jgi:predicted nucleic acid-binding protein
MNVLVDTCIWSDVFRRSPRTKQIHRPELLELINEGRAAIIGPIRQELLCGIKSQEQYLALRDALREFEDIPLTAADYETAAQYYNLLRSKGIQGSNTDYLICAVAVRGGLDIYTEDNDFLRYARHLPLRTYVPRLAGKA